MTEPTTTSRRLAARRQRRAGSGRRLYDAAVRSLADADALAELLQSHYQSNKMNGFFLDALDHANRLVTEMKWNLDDVMERYSPEECGL